MLVVLAATATEAFKVWAGTYWRLGVGGGDEELWAWGVGLIRWHLRLCVLKQSAERSNVSPMTPLLPARVPGFVIDPVAVSTKEGHPIPVQVPRGFSFGTIHGFTQRGFTGIMGLEPEGLNASAVAVALTLEPEYLLPNKEKTRAKKIGRFERFTVT